MSDDQVPPFSQRYGYSPLPPQLALNELPSQLRHSLAYAFDKSFLSDVRRSVRGERLLEDDWLTIMLDFRVKRLSESPYERTASADAHRAKLKSIFLEGELPHVFDLIEFVLGHRLKPPGLADEVRETLVASRAAYRLVDGKVITPVGSSDEADGIERAFVVAEESGAVGSRAHLLKAGVALRGGDWAGCVRESIHAVEAVAVMLAPGKDTLGAALAVLEKGGSLHGGLKSAFSTLYGYTSEEEGVRHSLVFQDEARVDETDALFMFGACASFVTYLLSRAGGEALLEQKIRANRPGYPA